MNFQKAFTTTTDKLLEGLITLTLFFVSPVVFVHHCHPPAA
jgi:hypothetical protein